MLTDSVSGTQKTNTGSVVSGALTTKSANGNLLAFIISDTATTPVHAISGGGLTWTQRATFTHVNISQGRMTVWSAPFTAPITAQTFTATDSGTAAGDMSLFVGAFLDTPPNPIGATTGIDAVTGAPTASLTTTNPNSWVWGLYYDTTANTTPTLAAGNIKQLDFADTNDLGRQVVISKLATTPLLGTPVTINATAPTTDATMLLLVEILGTSPSFRTQNLRPHPFSPGLAR